MYFEISRIIRLLSIGLMAAFFSVRKSLVPALTLSSSCAGTGLSFSFFSSSTSLEENRSPFRGLDAADVSFFDFDANRGDDAPHPSRTPSEATMRLPVTNTKTSLVQKSPDARGLMLSRPVRLSKVSSQRFAAGCVPQSADRFLLDLPNSFARKVEFFSNLLERQ